MPRPSPALLPSPIVLLAVLLFGPGTARADLPGDPPDEPPTEPEALKPGDGAQTGRVPMFVTSRAPGVRLYESTGILESLRFGNRVVLSSASQVGLEKWERFRQVCEAPCNHAARLDARYFVDGDAYVRSEVFMLQAPARGYRVDVRPGSVAGRATAAVLAIAGTAALFVGIGLHLDANQAVDEYLVRPMARPDFSFADNDRQHNIGSALIGTGWVVLIAGAVGIALTATHADVTALHDRAIRVTPAGLTF